MERAIEARVARYRLRERLGSGGLGVVYRARDPELSRDVAVKLIRHGKTDEAAFSRLRREAAALARVSHPNVVAVFDVGRYDAGDQEAWPIDLPLRGVYIVMELVLGTDLHRWLEQRRSLPEVRRVFLAAGRGLAAAHAAGVVHRDFKPGNVILDHDGNVKVVDFGLARWLHGSAAPETVTMDELGEPPASSHGSMTATGFVMGTPAYMAPEQHLGREIDARTDQYAFCVALAEALCGRRPFHGETLAELAAAKQSLHIDPSLREIPIALRAVIERGLACDPEDRWPTMDALLGALQSRRAWAHRWIALGVVGAAAATAWAIIPDAIAPPPAVTPAADPIAIDDARLPSGAAETLRARAEAAFVAGDAAAIRVAIDEVTAGLDLPEADPALAAEAMYWRGRLVDDQESAEVYRTAFFLAEDAKVPSIAARSAIAMLGVVAGDHGGAFNEWSRHAWVAIEKGPWDRGAAIDVAVTIAHAMAIAMPTDNAVEAVEIAAAVVEDVTVDDGPYVAWKLVHLAAAYRFVEEPELALFWARRAKALIEATADPGHTVYAMADEEIGHAIARMHRCDEAIPHLERAHAGFERQAEEPIRVSTALVGGLIADCLRTIGRTEAAIDEYRRTLVFWQTMPREYGMRELQARLAIARLYAELGRRDAAAAEYERAIEVTNPIGPDHPLRQQARAELAALRSAEPRRKPSVKP